MFRKASGLQRWLEQGDVDGINISSAVRPSDLKEFARLVSPELMRRGLLPKEDCPVRTFRERVLNNGSRLADDHRGAGFRAAADEGSP